MATATRTEHITANAVRELLRESGRPPSVREVARRLGLRSSSTVQQRLQRAVDMGLLEQRGQEGSVRAYWPVGAANTCPVCGQKLPETEA